MIKKARESYKGLIPGLLLITAAWFSTSCEDEVIDRFIDIPGDTVTISGINRIVAFKVGEFSPDTVLEAAIKDDSLLVYWPTFKTVPSTISPDIIISKGASINPSSGESVPFETGTKYTVKAEDQSEKEYTLKVVLYQPVPWYSRTFSDPLSTRKNDLIFYQLLPEIETNSLFIRGDLFIPNTTQTRMYVTSLDTEKETQLKIIDISINLISLLVPSNLDPGYYSTKLTSGIHSIIDDSVWFKYQQPDLFFWDGSPIVEQGNTFLVNGNHIRDIDKVQLYIFNSNNSTWEPLPPFEIVEGYTSTSIALRVPQDFPEGQYTGEVHIYTEWADSGKGKFIMSRPRRGSITITSAQSGSKSIKSL